MLRNHASFQRRAVRVGVIALAVAALAGCAETQLAVHAAKRVGPGSVSVPDGVRYKVGTPYQIAGTWYTPAEDFDYVETGVASWYGPDFHGKATANGEVYDMNDLTAAHRTLPMPSVVRVTNMENGRSLVLRVNDRGPFARNRIIDVSRRGAQLLGFESQGTARVRVEILPEESIAMRDAILGGQGGGRVVVAASTPATVEEAAPRVSASPAAPVVAVDMAPTPLIDIQAPPPAPPPGPAPSRVIANAPGSTMIAGAVAPIRPTPPAAAAGSAPSGDQPYIQAGAFSSLDNARSLEARLQGFGATVVQPVETASGRLFRVRIGPLDSAATAAGLLPRVHAAGHRQAVVVVD